MATQAFVHGYRVFRLHDWDDENRLRLLLDSKTAAYYGYDGNGERVYKLTGRNNVLSHVGNEINADAVLDDAVLYPNPYIVITPKSYTKHYYAGSERLATVIGQGGFNLMDTCISHFSALEENLCANIFKRYDKSYPLEYKYFDASQHNETIEGKQEDGVQYKCNPMVLNKLTLHYDHALLLNHLDWASGTHGKETDIYFYHGDHLGSANWITDAVGQPVQYIHYAPYGELIADTRLTDYRERFTFTGKERDKESGYDYFGARYYWALLMHWLSVDPLAHKYPWLSPYAYCGWNPIKYFDPDGRELVVSFNTTPHNQSHTDYIKNSYLKYYSQKNYSNSSPIIHFWAHGAHNGIRLGDDTAIRTPQGMYEYLNNQSLEFKANCATGEPSVLVLHSCSTGSGKNSFAQQLSTSEYFSKTLVIAPSSILEVGEKETIKDSGGWIAFYNGSPVGSINGYDTPWYKFWGEQKEAVQLSDFFKDMTVEQIFKYFNIENNK